uniref:Glutaredoxin domain-containing protein n=1 Tax=Panagrellus redivivus TaxID=6233 RepID=A0A7E4WAL1_PANRE
MSVQLHIPNFFKTDEFILGFAAILIAYFITALVKLYNDRPITNIPTEPPCFRRPRPPQHKDRNYLDFDEDRATERQTRYEKYLREAAEQQARSIERKRLRMELEAAELNGTDANANIPVSFDPFDSPEEFVKTKLESNRILVFVRRNCPFSTRALDALNTFPIASTDIEIVELDDYSIRAALKIQGVLEAITGEHSVPRVFIGGKCVGGGKDTEDALKDGRLEELLREAKAIQ